MTKLFKVESSGLPLIKEGEYEAVFDGYEDVEKAKFGPTIKLKFRITEGEYKDTVIDMLASAKLTPKTKFGQVVSTLKGGELKVDEELDLESLVGTPCTIVVVTIHADSGDFSRIEKLKPRDNKLPF